MSNMMNSDKLFENAINYPDLDIKERLSRLVGLDDHKTRLTKILGVLINKTNLEAWMQRYHANHTMLINIVLRRPPLVIFAGDVGSGKTELAETIGDAVAREQNIDITLLPLSLSSRGQGRVGEMTQLLSEAFDYTLNEARKLKNEDGKNRGGLILLVDEADALAQSREATQMHHEDRAGVNAFIRGIDRLANARIPVAVIMCTNRFGALDPAVRRRAADILFFERPNNKQRWSVFQRSLYGLGFSEADIEKLVDATGCLNGRDYGFTFSDITQRLLPDIVLDAYPKNPIESGRALEIAQKMTPTAPFEEN